MAGIGGVACDLVKARIPELGERVETWQVPGLDGFGSHKLGMGDSEASVTAIQHDTKSNLMTWIQQLTDLRGELISVADDWGDTLPAWTRARALLVERVEVIEWPVYNSIAGARAKVRVTGKAVQAPP